ncbi:BQ5605_C011g06528 [Microbotryum silenes-dioicae]|uniref:BQ5605_C011g06528 protein n=1 Tax=Microbotryum silenes-dioicae TaxID=796604 RepID=A0A2X0NS54_9BASI|nr:BQ5605_C011g06528 [Microbotryum silenes-dioicae]
MSTRASSEVASAPGALDGTGMLVEGDDETAGVGGTPPASHDTDAPSSPGSSSAFGGDGKPNKDAKAKGRFTCDACKLRKVRCIQEGQSCVQCSRHGIPCTFTPHVRKKMEPRAGKRIVLAKTGGTLVDSAAAREHGTALLNTSASSNPVSLSQLGKDGQPLSLVARRLQNAVAARVATSMSKDTGISAENEEVPYRQPAAVPFSSVVAAQRAEAIAREAAREAREAIRLYNESPLVRYSGDTLADQQLSTALITHLIELFKATPQYWLGLFSLPVLSSQVQAVNGRLYDLPASTQVLARSVIALTACISSHPLLFTTTESTPSYYTHSSRIPSFKSINRNIPSLFGESDLREFGKRRAHACDKLREQAIGLAWEYGALVHGGRENVASCHLLGTLIGDHAVTSPMAGKPYSVAHATHLRELCVEGIPDPETEWTFLIVSSNRPSSALPQACAQLMRIFPQLLEALNSLSSSTISIFEEADELLLAGLAPEPLESSASAAATLESAEVFDRCLYPFLYHATHLARRCVRQISGTFARSHWLDEAVVASYLSDLELLGALRSKLDTTAENLLDDKSSMPAHDGDSQVEVLSAIRFMVTVAWSSLVLPLLLNLQARIDSFETSNESGKHATSDTTKRRAVAVDLLAEVYRRVGIRAGAMLAERVRDVPSLAWLTPGLMPLRLAEWTKLLIRLPAAPGEALEGALAGGSLSVGEKAERLEWLLNGMRLAGWATVSSDTDEAVTEVENFLISPPGDELREDTLDVEASSPNEGEASGVIYEAEGSDGQGDTRFLITDHDPKQDPEAVDDEGMHDAYGL